MPTPSSSITLWLGDGVVAGSPSPREIRWTPNPSDGISQFLHPYTVACFRGRVADGTGTGWDGRQNDALRETGPKTLIARCTISGGSFDPRIASAFASRWAIRAVPVRTVPTAG